MLPLEQIVGLGKPNETWQWEEIHQHMEVDLVSHEVGKYLRLLVKNNGYIMEQVDWDMHRQRLDKLAVNMEQACEASSLPDNADPGPINDFLVSIRLEPSGIGV